MKWSGLRLDQKVFIPEKTKNLPGDISIKRGAGDPKGFANVLRRLIQILVHRKGQGKLPAHGAAPCRPIARAPPTNAEGRPTQRFFSTLLKVSRLAKMLAISAAFSVPQVHSGRIASAKLRPSGVSA